ncbi:MAG TPA: PxKF domain-containing protein [Pyrinomonadaceae bacterium]
MGFFQPVDNLPIVNVANAGSAIPLKFSLGGYHGLAIFAAGFPTSGQVQCNVSEPAGEVEETVNSGGSSLTYDAVTDRYTYVWKTNKAWKGMCRLMTVRFDDGTERSAKFRFK